MGNFIFAGLPISELLTPVLGAVGRNCVRWPPESWPLAWAAIRRDPRMRGSLVAGVTQILNHDVEFNVQRSEFNLAGAVTEPCHSQTCTGRTGHHRSHRHRLAHSQP